MAAADGRYGSSERREAAARKLVRQKQISDRVQRAIIQKALMSAREEVWVVDVVRSFGTKRGKVTRKEVEAAALAMEDDESELVMLRGDIIYYIGPTVKEICKRGEGHA